MKIFKTICVLLCLCMLCSCTEQREMNIEEYISKINAENEILPSAEKFTVYRNNEKYRYSAVLSQHLMLNIASGTDGEITEITLVTDRPDKRYSELRPVLLSAFTDKGIEECTQLISDAENKVKLSFGMYNIAVIDCGSAETFLINYADDELNTNECPTLKRHVDQIDISRPADNNGHT